MKKLTVSDGELLLKAWSSVVRSEEGAELDYPNTLYNTFLLFLARKGMLVIPPDVVNDERRIMLKTLSLEYVRALRDVLDPQRENEEEDLVLMLMLATADERRQAITNMKKAGIKF